MTNVIPFPTRPVAPEFAPDIDLVTAVAVAIRDLRDLAERLRGDSGGLEQALQCMDMLSRALETSREAG